eukprot:CAMPEP_0180337956 /NCGR_PEP_ID=MMETSP0988-20121125/45663_1 /TAXON_ID=697907 /ORGANISM="non described non described, Strain CCMP2293" /LENGTH=1067 /DNA_ID=CAMNT_0022326345 /DNA_START=21 /DNA_END=3225 /DNA_ORIENTATION=-
MPGTPRRKPRTPGGSLLADKENDPAGAASPGAMSKEKKRSARVSRRFSVLKVLGRTEVPVSPQPPQDEPRAEQGEGASSKRRRQSRVSFGSIHTATYVKDADRNDSPSPGTSLNNSNVPHTNLSALPDNTMESPAGSPEESCVPMDLTRGSCIPHDLSRGSVGPLDFHRRSAGPRDSLPGLPQVEDMFDGEELGSFGDEEEQPALQEEEEMEEEQEEEQDQPEQAGQIGCTGLAAMLDDDDDDSHPPVPSGRRMSRGDGNREFRRSSSGALEFQRRSSADGADADYVGDLVRADNTDHNLTSDLGLPTVGIGSRTGQVLQTGGLTGGVQGMDLTVATGGIIASADMEESTAGMDFTAAQGGILEASRRKSRLAASAEMEESTAAMEFTAAHGGILGASRRKSASADMEESTAHMDFTAAYGVILGASRRQSRLSAEEAGAEELQGIQNTLSRINGKAAYDEAAAGGASSAMEMTGTFGKILASVNSGNEDADMDAETEEDEPPAPKNKTYVDDNVTMFTPLSRIKSRKSETGRNSFGGGEGRQSLSGGVAEEDEAQVSPELEARPRTRSRTPTKDAVRKESKESKEGGRAAGGSRRRSLAAPAAHAVTWESFSDEMNLVWKDNGNDHKKKKATRKSELPLRQKPDEERSVEEELQEMMVSELELGNLKKNTKKVIDMKAALTADVVKMLESFTDNPPPVFAVMTGMVNRTDAEDERLDKAEAAMKRLRQYCRAKATTSFHEWRAQASRNFEALLDNVRQALAEDLDVLDERLAACRAAVKAAGEERREAIDALLVEKKAQMDNLLHSEQEQGDFVTSLEDQVAKLKEEEAAHDATLEAMRDAAVAPLPDADDAMPLSEEPATTEQVNELHLANDVLQGVSAWRPKKLSASEVSLSLPSGRILSVVLSDKGAVSRAFMVDAPNTLPRTKFEEALWNACGATQLVQGVKQARGLAPALEEAALRARRVEGLVAEVRQLARRHNIRTGVAPDGSAQVVVTVLNAPGNFKIALTLTLQWHYPAGKIGWSSKALAGEVDRDWVEEVMTTHGSGRARLTRIVADLAEPPPAAY